MAGTRKTALLIAALLALAWQSLVAQTHVHPDALCLTPITVSAACAPSVSASNPGKPDNQPADCPLCQAQFLSGHLLGSAAATIAPPVEILFVQTAVTALFGTQPARSHRWQSRAPPAPIHI